MTKKKRWLNLISLILLGLIFLPLGFSFNDKPDADHISNPLTDRIRREATPGTSLKEFLSKYNDIQYLKLDPSDPIATASIGENGQFNLKIIKPKNQSRFISKLQRKSVSLSEFYDELSDLLTDESQLLIVLRSGPKILLEVDQQWNIVKVIRVHGTQTLEK